MTTSASGEAGPPLLTRVPPQLFFAGSAVFHYLGPSFAVLLFGVVPVAGVAWMRIVSAALVFAFWRKPWRAMHAWNNATRSTIIALGVVFATMNLAFYNAIDRLPLGTVSAIEFTGPVLLALAGSRTVRNIAALVLAAAGVYVLTDARIDGGIVGFQFAFVNALLFTTYIVLAHRLSRNNSPTNPIDRLGAAMLVAAIVITPIGIAAAAPAFTNPRALLAGIGIGISSSVVPYVFDQLAMARLSRATYSLFVALLPAVAVVIGLTVLAQIPSAADLVGVALVIAGVATHREVADKEKSGSSGPARGACAR